MGAVIIASTAALLGTSDDDDGTAYRRYEFRRESIDGGAVELTVDRPSATFFVNVTAVDFGPEGVISTNSGQAILEGTVESAELNRGEAPPRVEVRIATPRAQDSEESVLDLFTSQVALPFSGNCTDPSRGTACSTHFSVEVRRADDGEAGGKVTFAWHFALSATGQVEREPNEEAQVGPVDPPWTVEVTEP